MLYLEDIVMLLKLNAITAAIRGQISLNMRQITCMHFEHISCFGVSVIFTLILWAY